MYGFLPYRTEVYGSHRCPSVTVFTSSPVTPKSLLQMSPLPVTHVYSTYVLSESYRLVALKTSPHPRLQGDDFSSRPYLLRLAARLLGPVEGPAAEAAYVCAQALNGLLAQGRCRNGTGDPAQHTCLKICHIGLQGPYVGTTHSAGKPSQNAVW